MNGRHFVWGLTTVASIAVAACSSSKSGGACDFVCATENPMSQIQSNDTCAQCTASSCSSLASAAYGSNWQSGNICAGTCGSYVGCIAACSCTDTACFTACTASSACVMAEEAASDCQQQHCAAQCGDTQTNSSSGGQASSSSGSSGVGTGTVTNGVCDGVAGSSGCPTANVVGCCIVTGAEICFYSPTLTAADAMQSCSAESGTFQTSP